MAQAARKNTMRLCYRSRLSRVSQDQGLGAVGAALGVNRDLAQALGTLLGGRIGGCRSLAHARNQGVDRRNDEEVDGRGHEEERDQGVDRSEEDTSELQSR